MDNKIVEKMLSRLNDKALEKITERAKVIAKSLIAECSEDDKKDDCDCDDNGKDDCDCDELDEGSTSSAEFVKTEKDRINKHADNKQELQALKRHYQSVHDGIEKEHSGSKYIANYTNPHKEVIKHTEKLLAKHESINEENTYVSFHNGKQHVTKDTTLYGAHKQALAHFKPKKSQAHMVHTHIAQKDGEDVIHTATEDTMDVTGSTGTTRVVDNGDEDDGLDENMIDIIEHEDGHEYFLEQLEDGSLEERFTIRVNAMGKRSRKLVCPKGRTVKSLNGRKICMPLTGQARQNKKNAIRKALRTKKAKGAGYMRRISMKRGRAMKRRHGMGL